MPSPVLSVPDINVFGTEGGGSIVWIFISGFGLLAIMRD